MKPAILRRHSSIPQTELANEGRIHRKFHPAQLVILWASVDNLWMPKNLEFRIWILWKMVDIPLGVVPDQRWHLYCFMTWWSYYSSCSCKLTKLYTGIWWWRAADFCSEVPGILMKIWNPKPSIAIQFVLERPFAAHMLHSIPFQTVHELFQPLGPLESPTFPRSRCEQTHPKQPPSTSKKSDSAEASMVRPPWSSPNLPGCCPFRWRPLASATRMRRQRQHRRRRHGPSRWPAASRPWLQQPGVPGRLWRARLRPGPRKALSRSRMVLSRPGKVRSRPDPRTVLSRPVARRVLSRPRRPRRLRRPRRCRNRRQELRLMQPGRWLKGPKWNQRCSRKNWGRARLRKHLRDPHPSVSCWRTARGSLSQTLAEVGPRMSWLCVVVQCPLFFVSTLYYSILTSLILFVHSMDQFFRPCQTQMLFTLNIRSQAHISFFGM